MAGGLYSFETSGSAMSRIARLEDALPYEQGGNRFGINSAFTSVPSGLFGDAGLDVTSEGVSVMGSVFPFVNDNAFAFTATANSITIYWDGTNGSSVIVIRRANGTRVTVGGSSITVAGLAASTWYGFLPYWPAKAACQVGFVKGETGDPLIAFNGGTGASFAATAAAGVISDAKAVQNMADNEALSGGFIAFKTPAAGTSSGTGTGTGVSTGSGGGGSGLCVMLGTEIIPIDPAWDYCAATFDENEWIAIRSAGVTLNCVPEHRLYDPDGNPIIAKDFKAGDWIVRREGDARIDSCERFVLACKKIRVSMKAGHLFWANGYLSHNLKVA